MRLVENFRSDAHIVEGEGGKRQVYLSGASKIGGTAKRGGRDTRLFIRDFAFLPEEEEREGGG